MTFQFLCPQGHLLEGEEEHMGMECECPQCGTAFIIPVVDEALHAGNGSKAPAPPPVEPPAVSRGGAMTEAAADAGPGVDLSELPQTDLGKAAAADAVLHIPCPNGHALETPPEMIGQRARCPHCGAEFRLRRERSIEYQQEQEIIERRRAAFWFQLAILATCFVVIILLAMVGIMVFS